jgi:hypothetical protein
MMCFTDDESDADEGAAPAAEPSRCDATGVRCCYFMMPSQPNWEGSSLCGTGVANIGVGVTAAYHIFNWWSGGLPVPRPPVDGAWLLPTGEEHAIQVARWQDELRRAGWRVLSASEETVAELGSKDGLLRRATRLDLLEHLPQHYNPRSTGRVTYPCVLKPSVGWAGQYVIIVHDTAERARFETQYEARGAPWGPLLLQEWVGGSIEYSTSMVVCDGRLYATMAHTVLALALALPPHPGPLLTHRAATCVLKVRGVHHGVPIRQ